MDPMVCEKVGSYMNARKSMPFWTLLLSVPMAVFVLNAGTNNDEDETPDDPNPTTELSVDMNADTQATADISDLSLNDGNSDEWRGRGWGRGWGGRGWGGYGGWYGGWGGYGGWYGGWGGYYGWPYSYSYYPYYYTYPYYYYY
jgi:hypothetical protein